MLLYVHVPFCVRKCGYCAFHSGPFSAPEAERYVEFVLREHPEVEPRGKAAPGLDALRGLQQELVAQAVVVPDRKRRLRAGLNANEDHGKVTSPSHLR